MRILKALTEIVFFNFFRQKIAGKCPYCGKRLRTKNAKQCCHCLMDWHTVTQPHFLKNKA